MMNRIATCVTMVTVGVFGLAAAGCALDGPDGAQAAAGGADPPADTSTTRPSHCVGAGASNAVHCYPTFREAIAFATGGGITDAPDAPDALADDRFTGRLDSLAAATAGPFVVGILYKDVHFGGSSYTLQEDHGCDGDLSTVDFSVPDLRVASIKFNDVISSFKSFAGCQAMLFEDIHFAGATTQKATESSNVGPAMNDRTSSIRWF